MKIKYLILSMAIILPGITVAHNGHGAISAERIAHYIISPVHAIPFLLVLAMVIYVGLRKYPFLQK